MDGLQIGIIAAVIVLGSALQTAVGFGAGLLSIPIMVWAGVSLPQAVTIAMVFTAAHNGWGAWRHRRDIHWRAIGLISLTRVAAQLPGVALMALVVALGEDVVKRGVGLGLLLVLGLMTALRTAPRPRIGWGWTVGAGVISGILGGVIGMGGPPLVLWVMAHDWTADQARASLWAIFTLCLPPLLAVLAWHFGLEVLIAIGIGVVGLPLSLAGSMLGRHLTRGLSASHLRRVSYAILTLIALSLIVQSL